MRPSKCLSRAGEERQPHCLVGRTTNDSTGAFASSPHCRVHAILTWGLLLATAAADAQGIASVEKISFAVIGAFERGAAVSGELRIPVSKRDRLPAVVIVDSSPGMDGRGALYAEALTGAGIATLEIDMFQGRGLPASPRDNLPHVFQSLQYLARHPGIDATRIGVMGFSWGAIVSMLTSSEELAREYSRDDLRFAAHLALYPQCWYVRSLYSGKAKSFKTTPFERVSERPVRILAGDKDDYDDRDGCARFLAELPDPARAHFSLTVYAGASFAWDSRFSSATYSAGANKGKGGIVNVIANPDIAHRSKEAAVAFFGKNLAAD